MFTPAHARAATAYRSVGVSTSVEGASPHQLVNLIFEALLQSVNAARGAMARGDVAVKGSQIGRAVRLLQDGLVGALDKQAGGDLAARLGSLYDYCVERLTAANMQNDDAALAEVIRLIEPVAQGWKEIGQNAGHSMSAASTGV